MPNRLARETSPYLLQHAENPVDWHPWGDEALALARREGKPILLSIGYSACHWCHVMAHESFEDEAVAAVMNRLFINIKVDREERPDLDQIYQSAHQMLNRRSGGWPLTVFMDPAGAPFFSGTYFPKESRYGLPGFVGLMDNIARAWTQQQKDIRKQNDSLREALLDMDPPVPHGKTALSPAPIATALRLLESHFDPQWGGFGGAPKFPHPTDLALLLRSPQARHKEMACLSLRRMAEGGLFDHLGGGFCRYSVDGEWRIPHFEKMLYDNGPLLGLYAEAWRQTGDEFFHATATATAAWVLTEMRAPGGGFYSALDADSEGEEGKFYVWDRDDIRALLSPEEYALAAGHWGLLDAPNFEHAHWHLQAVRPLAEVAAALGHAPGAAKSLLASAKAKLLAARSQRIRPGTDDKILTSWNALMIESLLRAGRILGQNDWIAAAQESLDFIRRHLWQDGRLLATGKAGSEGFKAHLKAYLDDYAFLLAACIESLQAHYRPADLAFATALADALVQHFEDPDHGGFYFTAHDHEALFHRPMGAQDNATPSGNGVAALALQRLACLTGEPRYDTAAQRTLQRFYPSLQENPSANGTLLTALDEALIPPRLLVLRGPAPELPTWAASALQHSSPGTLILALDAEQQALPAPLDKPLSDRVNAWQCEGVKCLPPLEQLAELPEVVSKPRNLL